MVDKQNNILILNQKITLTCILLATMEIAIGILQNNVINRKGIWGNISRYTKNT